MTLLPQASNNDAQCHHSEASCQSLLASSRGNLNYMYSSFHVIHERPSSLILITSFRGFLLSKEAVKISPKRTFPCFILHLPPDCHVVLPILLDPSNFIGRTHNDVMGSAPFLFTFLQTLPETSFRGARAKARATWESQRNAFSPVSHYALPLRFSRPSCGRTQNDVSGQFPFHFHWRPSFQIVRHSPLAR